MNFQPSAYSGTDDPTDLEVASLQAQQAKAESWTSAISAISGLAQTGIALTAGAVQARKTRAHELAMSEKQAQLYGLQAQAAALQRLATTKTLLLVGGVVVTFGIIAATVVALRRSGDEYEDE